MAKTLIVYHRGDFDGICGAFIAQTANPGAVLLGMEHGIDDPILVFEHCDLDTDVVMLDYSLQPYGDMHDLVNNCKSLTWIDHHSSVLKAVGDIKAKGLRSTEFAACELCWMYYYPDREMPRAVRLLGRYDVWDHDGDDDICRFQYGLRSYDDIDDPQSFLWRQLIWEIGRHTFEEEILKYGHKILAYHRQMCEIAAQNSALEAELDGYRVIAINNALSGSPWVEPVYDPKKHDIMSVYSRVKSGWKVSLYTQGDGKPDVGEIAKRHGGGGHSGAAGFLCKELPFVFGDNDSV